MPETTPVHEHHEPSRWPLWLAGGTAAFILSPYLLPIIGIGTSDITKGSMLQLHATKNLGEGLAGDINGVLNSVPLIGEHLVSGGWLNVAASATIGIGGVMLANWLEKREDQNASIKWSKIIRYASLATSIFIALPAILTSISVAAVFFSNLPEVSVANKLSMATSEFFAKTLGAMGSMEVAQATSNILSVTFTHLLTCGAAIIPPSLALFMSRGRSAKSPESSNQESAMPEDEPESSWQNRVSAARHYERLHVKEHAELLAL